MAVDGLSFAIEEMPIHERAPEKVLVAVRAAGICRSDVHLIVGTLVQLAEMAAAGRVGLAPPTAVHVLLADTAKAVTRP